DHPVLPPAHLLNQPLERLVGLAREATDDVDPRGVVELDPLPRRLAIDRAVLHGGAATRIHSKTGRSRLPAHVGRAQTGSALSGARAPAPRSARAPRRPHLRDACARTPRSAPPARTARAPGTGSG